MYCRTADNAQMNTHLQLENDSLRQQLEVLLHEARQNEDKMRRFDLLQRQLIGADSLPDLIQLLLSEYQLAFGVEFVTLALVDQEYEIARMLESGRERELSLPGLTLLSTPFTLEKLYGARRTPHLGPFDSLPHQILFDAPTDGIASVALLPLVRRGVVIGSLHFGSTNSGRYVADCGTAFLERLAEFIAICLESSLSQERLKLMGLTDALTGAQNRRYFDHRLEIEVSLSLRYQHSLACMFFDIDKFKQINDNHGHQTGDEVLRRVAGIIQLQLRAGDTLARYGGEEFVALLPRTEMPMAHKIAERIRISIAETAFTALTDETLALTISTGVSTLDHLNSDKGKLGEQMIAAADQALYYAKENGRNRVVCANELVQEAVDDSDTTPVTQRALVFLKQLASHF